MLKIIAILANVVSHRKKYGTSQLTDLYSWDTNATYLDASYKIIFMIDFWYEGQNITWSYNMRVF